MNREHLTADERRLLDLHAKARSGRWTCVETTTHLGIYARNPKGEMHRVATFVRGSGDSSAEFCVEAHAQLPALLETLAGLRNDLEVARGGL